jgi:hypothetical protein
MAERKIFSCDWCGVDSPSPGFVGELWKRFDSVEYGTHEWLCEKCVAARVAALDYAKANRQGQQRGSEKRSTP